MSWIILALLAAIFAALVAILGKIGLTKVDPTLATTLRVVVMAVFLSLWTLVLNKWKLLSSVDFRAVWFIIFSAIAGGLSMLAYFFALKNGPASGVSALDRLSVVFVLVFALIFLGEQLTWKSGVGAIILTIGAILMAWK